VASCWDPVNFDYVENPDRFWLIPTAEVPLTNICSGAIVDGGQLPMLLTAARRASAPKREPRAATPAHDPPAQFTKSSWSRSPHRSYPRTSTSGCCPAPKGAAKAGAGTTASSRSAPVNGLCITEDRRHRGVLPGQNMLSQISSCSCVRRFPSAADECALPRKDNKPASCIR